MKINEVINTEEDLTEWTWIPKAISKYFSKNKDEIGSTIDRSKGAVSTVNLPFKSTPKDWLSGKSIPANMPKNQKLAIQNKGSGVKNTKNPDMTAQAAELGGLPRSFPDGKAVSHGGRRKYRPAKYKVGHNDTTIHLGQRVGGEVKPLGLSKGIPAKKTK